MKKKIKDLNIKKTCILDFLTARELKYLSANLLIGRRFEDLESIDYFYKQVELTEKHLKERIKTLESRIKEMQKIKENVESRVAKKELNL